jgi:hypothetical protein
MVWGAGGTAVIMSHFPCGNSWRIDPRYAFCISRAAKKLLEAAGGFA